MDSDNHNTTHTQKQNEPQRALPPERMADAGAAAGSTGAPEQPAVVEHFSDSSDEGKSRVGVKDWMVGV